jgi:hypothetical protein
MIKLSEECLGAIDDAKPYFAKYDGIEKLTDVLKGKVKNCWWKTISAEEAEQSKVLILMYTKSMHINLKSIKSKTITASIHGLLINTRLFINENYRTCNIDNDLYMNNSIELKHFGTVHDFNLRGRFNVYNCSYYYDFE